MYLSLLSLFLVFGFGACGNDVDVDGIDGVTITHTTDHLGRPCTVAKTAEGVSIDCEDDGK